MELKFNEFGGVEGKDVSFNRTFMELKFESCPKKRELNIVLIVPLWNWNQSR